MHKAHSARGFYFVHDSKNGGLLPTIFKTLDSAQDSANRCLQPLHSSKSVDAQAAELVAKLLAHNASTQVAKNMPHQWAKVAAERRKLIQ